MLVFFSFILDLKSSVVQSDSHNHHHHHHQSSSTHSIDRSKSQLSSSNPLLSTSIASALPLSNSRTHSHVSSLQAFSSNGLHLTSPSSESTANTSIISGSPVSSALTSQTIIPSKYEFSHSALLHGDNNFPTNNNLNNNSTGNYLQSQLAYGNVKSETNPNYDYMNSCLQSGYFNSSFGTIGGTAATTTASHSVADLASYHHQHNVIQAAKLMATS